LKEAENNTRVMVENRILIGIVVIWIIEASIPEVAYFYSALSISIISPSIRLPSICKRKKFLAQWSRGVCSWNKIDLTNYLTASSSAWNPQRRHHHNSLAQAA